jgi:hypothetical protein
LPEWNIHCAELAVETLREAIGSYRRGVDQRGGDDNATT